MRNSLFAFAFVALTLSALVVAGSYSSNDFEHMLPEKYYASMRDAGRAYEGKRFEEAFNLFHRAACAGDKSSQAAVGRMYLLGQGVRHSDLTGYAWLVLATERTFPAYQSLVETLRNAMTSEQMSIATARITALKQLYGLAATRVSCELVASTSTASNLKDTLLCTPQREGSQVLLHRCVDDVPY